MQSSRLLHSRCLGRQLAAQPPQHRHPSCRRPLRAARLPVQAMKTADGPSLAIVGVSGAVGQEFLRVGIHADFIYPQQSSALHMLHTGHECMVSLSDAI